MYIGAKLIKIHNAVAIRKMDKYIKDIIEENKYSIAFLFGNGIHRYFQKNSLPWDRLLEDLWIRYRSDKFRGIDSGLSYTEYYDIIELSAIHNFTYMTEERNRSGCLKITLKDLDKRLAQSVTNYMYDQLLIHNGHLFDSYNINCYNWGNDIIDEAIRTLKGYEVEIINPMVQLINGLSIDTIKNFYYNSIKRYVAFKVANWKSIDNIKIIVNKIMQLDAPLLTTNYDSVFVESIGESNSLLKRLSSKDSFNFHKVYPWNSYYAAQRLISPASGFGIWKIHGDNRYPDSIRLGLCDYMGCIQKARSMIQGADKSSIEDFCGKNQYGWKGWNTWLHIIFNKSLMIIGLGLEKDEAFLRWLLIQRAKWYNYTGCRYDGWYIIGPNDKLNKGKRLFLESVGFEIIKVPDYKIIYEDVWR